MEVTNALNTLTIYISSVAAEIQYGMKYIPRLPAMVYEDLFEELLELWSTSFESIWSTDTFYLESSLSDTSRHYMDSFLTKTEQSQSLASSSPNVIGGYPVLVSYICLLNYYTPTSESFGPERNILRSDVETFSRGLSLREISLCISSMLRNWSFVPENHHYFSQHGYVKGVSSAPVAADDAAKPKDDDRSSSRPVSPILDNTRNGRKRTRAKGVDPILEIYIDEQIDTDSSVWIMVMRSFQAGIMLHEGKAPDSTQVDTTLSSILLSSNYLSECSSRIQEQNLRSVLEYRKNALTMLNNFAPYVQLEKVPPAPFMKELMMSDKNASTSYKKKERALVDLDIDLLDMLFLITCDFLTSWVYVSDNPIQSTKESNLPEAGSKVNAEELDNSNGVSFVSSSEHYMLLSLDTVCKLLVKDENRAWMKDDWFAGRILKQKAPPNVALSRLCWGRTTSPTSPTKETFVNPRKLRRERILERIWNSAAHILLDLFSTDTLSALSTTEQAIIEHLLIALHYIAPFVFGQSWMEAERKRGASLRKREKKIKVPPEGVAADLNAPDEAEDLLTAERSIETIKESALCRTWWNEVTFGGSLIRLFLHISLSSVTSALPATPENKKDTIGLCFPFASSISLSSSHRASLILAELTQTEHHFWSSHVKDAVADCIPLLSTLVGRGTIQGGRVMVGTGIGMIDPLLESLFT
jgi:hypothetical protein